jgi:hypothetical protein
MEVKSNNVSFKATSRIPELSTEILNNKTDSKLQGFERQDIYDLSIKMGMDVKKKEVLIEAKNSTWKEIFLVCFILFFIFIFLILIIIFFGKNKDICKKKSLGWSYRLN